MVKNKFNIPESWRKHRIKCFAYWFFHWFYVNKIALSHFRKVYPFHDIEKPFKLLFGVPYEKVSKDHVKNNRHHPQGKDPSMVDWTEVVCDWEASGYTKPNSLLDAYETMMMFYPKFDKYIIPVLEDGNLMKGR